MSEISKARERLLNQRVQPDPPLPQQSRLTNQPRKFTLSSLTQQFERSDPSPSPSNIYTRMNTERRALDSPLGSNAQWSHLSKSKQNQPMLKTINIKIHEMSRLTSQPSENEDNWPESRYLESPPRVAYRRTLHKAKPELIAAPLLSRKHNSPFKPRECLKQWAEGVLGQARALGRSFVDEYFPPARTIIVSRNILCQQQNLKFERLSRIYQECEVALLESCEPTYLSPGKYTNPYLYSALTILAQTPQRVLTLFGTQLFSEEGAYHVCLCKDGVWRYVVVDDFVPIKSIAGRKQMLSAHSKQAEGRVEIWPVLVEKAVAKIYGTYVDLMMSKEEGMVDLFKLLTGAPATVYELNKDFRSFLILVDSALKRGHVVTLEGANTEESETARLRNLSVFQAYRVLDIKKSGLKIRNYAQPELVSKLAFDECLLFSKLVIYRIQPSYRYITHKLRHKKNYFSKLSLTVANTTRAYFDVWQNNRAYYKKYLNSNIEYEPSRFRIWLSRGEEGEWVQGAKETELEKGEYELNVHLCQEKEMDFTVSYYGEKDVKMERVRSAEEWTETCLCNQL